MGKKGKLPPARKRKPRCGLCGQKMERGADTQPFTHTECIDGEPLSHTSCVKEFQAERRREAERQLRRHGFAPKGRILDKVDRAALLGGE